MRTRIVIPTVPPEPAPPHFDDEATIISARPVVPIPPAKIIQRKHILLVILSPLLSAAVFGAAAAIGVSYYENRQRAPFLPVTRSPVNQERATNQPSASQPETPNSAASDSEQRGGAASVISESDSPQPESSAPQSEAAGADEKVGLPANQSVATAANSSESGSPAVAIGPKSPVAADTRNGGTSYDPSRLVRKRRVHPASGRNDTGPPENERPTNKKKQGAGRIQEIFQGPNS
jgi:hypothetical protein